MIDLVVILRAKDPASLPELRDLLKEQVARSLQEPGCMRFELLESETNPGTFILIERWESQQALDTHREADACKTLYFPRIVPLVERTPHVCKSLMTS